MTNKAANPESSEASVKAELHRRRTCCCVVLYVLSEPDLHLLSLHLLPHSARREGAPLGPGGK